MQCINPSCPISFRKSWGIYGWVKNHVLLSQKFWIRAPLFCVNAYCTMMCFYLNSSDLWWPLSIKSSKFVAVTHVKDWKLRSRNKKIFCWMSILDTLIFCISIKKVHFQFVYHSTNLRHPYYISLWKDLKLFVNIRSTQWTGSILKICFVIQKRPNLHRAYLVSGPIFFWVYILCNCSEINLILYFSSKYHWFHLISDRLAVLWSIPNVFWQ